MSAKKVTESKKFEVDESTDSGFLSGHISEPLSSDDVQLPTESDIRSEAKVTSVSEELEDQGLCLLTGDLDISDDTPTALEPQPAPQPAPKSATTVTSEEARRLRNLLFSQDVEGDTPLHIAAVHGCIKSVGMLINLCPDKKLLNITNEYGHTPLHLAIMSGNDVVARMLVRAGADIAIRDHTGETPLHTAVSTGLQDCILALLDPAPGHKRIRSAVFDQKNYNGQSCVHLAAYAGRVDLLKTLVLYGANINVKEGCAGWTALHIAARRGDAALARYLRGAGAAGGAHDYAGRTPRRLARGRALRADLDSGSAGSDSDTDDEEYESDSEQLFSRVSGAMGAPSIDVV